MLWIIPCKLFFSVKCLLHLGEIQVQKLYKDKENLIQPDTLINVWISCNDSYCWTNIHVMHSTFLID